MLMFYGFESLSKLFAVLYPLTSSLDEVLSFVVDCCRSYRMLSLLTFCLITLKQISMTVHVIPVRTTGPAQTEWTDSTAAVHRALMEHSVNQVTIAKTSKFSIQCFESLLKLFAVYLLTSSIVLLLSFVVGCCRFYRMLTLPLLTFCLITLKQISMTVQVIPVRTTGPAQTE